MQTKALLILVIFTLFFPQIVIAQVATVGEYCQVDTNATDIVCQALAETTCSSADSVETCKITIKQKEGLGWLKKLMSGDVITQIWGLVTALLVVMLTWARAKVSSFKSRLADPTDKKFKFLSGETKGINVVLFGQGGVGKTSLIRAISGSPHANPQSATTDLDAYNIVHEVNVSQEGQESRRITRIWAEDHRGQRMNQRIHNSAVKDRVNTVPQSILIIVVDLFPPEVRGTLQTNIDNNRVESNLSRFQFDEIFGDIRDGIPHLKSIVLFVNKVDLLNTLSQSKIKSIKRSYQTLWDKINSQFPDKDNYFIIGAANSGKGVSGMDIFAPQIEKTLLEIIYNKAGNIKVKKKGIM